MLHTPSSGRRSYLWVKPVNDTDHCYFLPTTTEIALFPGENIIAMELASDQGSSTTHAPFFGRYGTLFSMDFSRVDIFRKVLCM